MDMKSIKAAYNAQRDHDETEQKLYVLHEQKAAAKRFYMTDKLHWYMEKKYQDKEAKLNEQLAKDRMIIDRVLQWAETAPKEIRQIIHARVTDMKPWEEISLELFNSSVPNTSYMKLKRFVDSTDQGRKMTD